MVAKIIYKIFLASHSSRESTSMWSCKLRESGALTKVTRPKAKAMEWNAVEARSVMHDNGG